VSDAGGGPPGGGAAAVAPDHGVPARFVPLEFVRVELELPAQHPTLLLREVHGPRLLAIPIGMAEGVAIAYAATQRATPRPLTHELFVAALRGLGATIETLRITAVHGTSYEAELLVSGATGLLCLPCRVSDGVCLALRHPLPVPLTAAESVLGAAALGAAS